MGAAVTRVNGPLVEVIGLTGAAMFDVVELGPYRLPGEIVALRGESATVQAYEYTGGLAPGADVRGRGMALTAPLGRHLLGGVFDGLLRPLAGAGAWLDPTAATRRAAAVQSGTAQPDAVQSGTAQPGGVQPGEGRSAVVLSGVATSGAPVSGAGERGTQGEDRQGAGTESWPVRRPRPYRERLDTGAPLHTGQRVIDLVFPVPRGGTVAVPGGFGTGKTMLLQQIAKWCDADVIIYVGCGERGNEMADVLSELAELTDPRTGGRLADRTVVIANTSNMPMMAREASVYSAVTVAEYFRDQGMDAVVIADSTSRWAEALREFASRGGELPAEEGYPAALASALAAFYERAGRVVTLGGQEGSVTIIGAVSPPGGDLAEPVTTHTQRFVRALWTLDRDLAYARHYPAVSWAGSFARDLDAVARWQAAHGDPGWAGRRARIAGLLAEADRLAALAELVGAGALPGNERVVILAGRLLREGVLQQSALSPLDASCDRQRAVVLAEAVLAVIDRCHELVGRGVPAATIEEADFSPLVRAREEAAEAQDVRDARDRALATLDGLEDLP